MHVATNAPSQSAVGRLEHLTHQHNSTQQQSHLEPLMFDECACFICRKPIDSGLYCSEACQLADSLSPSPAYATSAHGSSRMSSQDDLFFQDIPELDLGWPDATFGTGANATSSSSSVSRNPSRNNRQKTRSSGGSSPARRKDVYGGEHRHVSPRSPYSGVANVFGPLSTAGSTHSKSHGGGHQPSHSTSGVPPPFIDPNVHLSPSLKPVLRYSRRAYSTNVRAAPFSQLHSQPPGPESEHSTTSHTHHHHHHHRHRPSIGRHRTPSGNLLELVHQAPESSPTSIISSPIFEAQQVGLSDVKPSSGLGDSHRHHGSQPPSAHGTFHEVSVNRLHKLDKDVGALDGANGHGYGLGGTLSKTLRSRKNRRSLPLSFASHAPASISTLTALRTNDQNPDFWLSTTKDGMVAPSHFLLDTDVVADWRAHHEHSSHCRQQSDNYPQSSKSGSRMRHSSCSNMRSNSDSDPDSDADHNTRSRDARPLCTHSYPHSQSQSDADIDGANSGGAAKGDNKDEYDGCKFAHVTSTGTIKRPTNGGGPVPLTAAPSVRGNDTRPKRTCSSTLGPVNGTQSHARPRATTSAKPCSHSKHSQRRPTRPSLPSSTTSSSKEEMITLMNRLVSPSMAVTPVETRRTAASTNGVCANSGVSGTEDSQDEYRVIERLRAPTNAKSSANGVGSTRGQSPCRSTSPQKPPLVAREGAKGDDEQVIYHPTFSSSSYSNSRSSVSPVASRRGYATAPLGERGFYYGPGDEGDCDSHSPSQSRSDSLSQSQSRSPSGQIAWSAGRSPGAATKITMQDSLDTVIGIEFFGSGQDVSGTVSAARRRVSASARGDGTGRVRGRGRERERGGVGRDGTIRPPPASGRDRDPYSQLRSPRAHHHHHHHRHHSVRTQRRSSVTTSSSASISSVNDKSSSSPVVSTQSEEYPSDKDLEPKEPTAPMRMRRQTDGQPLPFALTHRTGAQVHGHSHGHSYGPAEPTAGWDAAGEDERRGRAAKRAENRRPLIR